MNVNPLLKEHVQAAGSKLTTLAQQHPMKYSSTPSDYEKACFESMPNAILYDIIFGSETLGLESAGLTDHELLLARAVLASSLVNWQSKLSPEGQKQVRLTVADFARRLAATYTHQEALELEVL